ncbi:MAG: LicD family protein [Acholeplasmatales bacterium]|nr:LicD family protein [Acholeplasmatales bacterium]
MSVENNKEALAKLHKILLEMISDIDTICRDNNIEYFLAGGSALGAHRHQGFIPWDDDLDIIMTIDNYLKFKEVCKTKLDTNKYYFQDGNTEENPLYFSKIRLKGTTLIEGNELYAMPKCPGIFIDIFVLFNTNNKFYTKKQYLYSRLLVANSLSKMGYKTDKLVKKLFLFMGKRISNKKALKYLKYLNKMQNKETAYYCDFIGRGKFRRKIFKKEIYGKPNYVKFENLMLPVPSMLEEYCRTHYGDDFMTLPPEEKRTFLHVKHLFFDKELTQDEIKKLLSEEV